MSTDSIELPSETNTRKIQAAMERLLAGQPLHTDGRLHVKNLACEAGLSRQQVYRSPLRAEFDEHVRRITDRAEAPTEPHLAVIARLREQLVTEQGKAARYRTERDEARAGQQTLANQLLVVDEQNRRLEATVAASGNVTSLAGRR